MFLLYSCKMRNVHVIRSFLSEIWRLNKGIHSFINGKEQQIKKGGVKGSSLL